MWKQGHCLLTRFGSSPNDERQQEAEDLMYVSPVAMIALNTSFLLLRSVSTISNRAH